MVFSICGLCAFIFVRGSTPTILLPVSGAPLLTVGPTSILQLVVPSHQVTIRFTTSPSCPDALPQQVYKILISATLTYMVTLGGLNIVTDGNTPEGEFLYCFKFASAE
jgi:hypothetical protein